MYIIWKYDLFPYKLCGKVVGKPTVGGFYHVKGYGKQSFEAIRVIKDDAKGKLVQEMLERETVTKRVEQKKLDDRFNNIVADCLVQIIGL
jgi:hypothetical protein